MEDNIKHRSWLGRLTNILSREPKNKAQLMATLRDAEERDLMSAEMLSMIESVLQVSEMQVREVMIPRSQMVAVDRESTLEGLLPLVIESGHSRFPVTDSSSNDVIGTILAKDLLRYYFQKDVREFEMADILRPATFIPQSKRLDILLKEFRINRNHMAIVIDEYGHVAGLVTIEDVLEQIVGDIEDEYDIDEDDQIKKHVDGNYTVKATTPIDDFNEYFNTEFSDEEFDTIGGLVLKGFGHLPKRGEKIKIENYVFKILHSDNRRIHLLEIKKETTMPSP
ncbi:MAG: transporter associated domain-containing protein [Gammaproteobacteria bacterium]|nr:transporter associated domain-containing protein [Gammaproteobacteria bacterium]